MKARNRAASKRFGLGTLGRVGVESLETRRVGRETRSKDSGRRLRSQFSKLQSGQMGPRLRIFEPLQGHFEVENKPWFRGLRPQLWDSELRIY